MSIKIFSGFIYDGADGLDGCYKHLDDIRPAAHQLIKRKFHYFLASVATDIIDRHTLMNEELSTAPLWAALGQWREMSDDNERRKMRGFSELDFYVTLYPVDGVIIGIPWGDYSFEEWFLSLSFIKEYGYWDNTDKPGKISTREWNTRGKRWKKAIPNDRTFMDCGLKIQLHSDYSDVFISFDVLDILPLIKSVEIRAREWAEKHIKSEMMKELPIGGLPIWLKSAEGVAAIDLRAKKYEKLLPVIDVAKLKEA